MLSQLRTLFVFAEVIIAYGLKIASRHSLAIFCVAHAAISNSKAGFWFTSSEERAHEAAREPSVFKVN